MNRLRSITEHRCSDRTAMTRGLTEEVCNRLAGAVAARGRAGLVVSGGRTPVSLFDELSCRTLPWEHIDIALADERWVPVDSEESNEHLVRQHLLRGAASTAHFIGLKNASGAPEAGLGECEKRLKSIPRPFDLVLLGIGEDGHTASLIPDAPELAHLLAPSDGALCGVSRPPSSPYPRVTMTLPCLLDTRSIIFHLFGADKWAVYQEALEGGQNVDMPVRAVLARQDDIPEAVFWAP